MAASLQPFRMLIPVPDIERATRFYALLFDAPGERVSPGRHYFSFKDLIVALYDSALDGDVSSFSPMPTHLYFATNALDEVFARVKNSGGRLSTVRSAHHGDEGMIAVRPWGERSFYADDPFGNPLCFVDAKTKFLGRSR